MVHSARSVHVRFDADPGIDSAREIREYFIPDFSNWKDHDSYEGVRAAAPGFGGGCEKAAGVSLQCNIQTRPVLDVSAIGSAERRSLTFGTDKMFTIVMFG